MKRTVLNASLLLGAMALWPFAAACTSSPAGGPGSVADQTNGNQSDPTDGGDGVDDASPDDGTDNGNNDPDVPPDNGEDPGTDPGDGGGTDDPPPVKAELGYTDQETGIYTPVGDGEVMPLFSSGQGGSHIFATLRATGFPTAEDGGADIALVEDIRLASSGISVHDFSEIVRFETTPDGHLEAASIFMFLQILPFIADGQTVDVAISLTSAEDMEVTAQIAQTVVLSLAP